MKEEVRKGVRRSEGEKGSGYVWYRAGDAESWRGSIGTVVDIVLQYGLKSWCGSCMVIRRMQLYKKAAEWNAQIAE